MDNREVSNSGRAKELSLELRQLPRNLLHQTLLQYALEITIMARAAFLEGNLAAAKDCNEVLHRLVGFLRKQSAGDGDDEAESMITTICESALKKGRLRILADCIRRKPVAQ